MDSTGAGVFISCENTDCASKHSNDLDAVNLYGNSRHDVYKVDGRFYGKCQVCGHERRYVDKSMSAYSGYNQSLGMAFKSRGEEREFAKKNGYEGV